MYIICSDLEGVFVPEIWVNVSAKTGIEELKLTTRDISDYDILMKGRLEILKKHNLTLKDIQKELQPFFAGKLHCDYQQYSGTYFSNSAFAAHLATDILERKSARFDFMKEAHAPVKSILVCNNLNNVNLGLTLFESVET